MPSALISENSVIGLLSVTTWPLPRIPGRQHPEAKRTIRARNRNFFIQKWDSLVRCGREGFWIQKSAFLFADGQFHGLDQLGVEIKFDPVIAGGPAVVGTAECKCAVCLG